MSAPGFAPRFAAAKLLESVLVEKRMLADVLNAKDGPLAALPPQGRARAQTLASDTLRHLGRIDIVIDQFLQKDPPLAVRNALRLATCELIVGGIAPHAAVDAAVRLVKTNKITARMSGLVNAISRRIAEHGAEIWQELDPTTLPDYLSTPIKKTYGKRALAAIEAAHEAGAPLDITPRDPAKIEELSEKLDAGILATGSLRLFDWGQISTMPGFETGEWWVQDASAAIPVQLLGVQDGQSVLDLCAAPGGKTMQLASAGGNVTAVDLSSQRMERVNENLKRTKLTAKLVVEDVLKYHPDQAFDAILLDAPCSATGTIRRHPDLPYVKTGLSLNMLLKLQQEMLTKAATWLAPGGSMVYCTCSLFPEEGEDQVAAFLENNSNFQQVKVDANKLGLSPDWVDKKGGLRLRPDYWPDRGGMDGFYISLLKRKD